MARAAGLKLRRQQDEGVPPSNTVNNEPEAPMDDFVIPYDRVPGSVSSAPAAKRANAIAAIWLRCLTSTASTRRQYLLMWRWMR